MSIMHIMSHYLGIFVTQEMSKKRGVIDTKLTTNSFIYILEGKPKFRVTFDL